MPNNFLTTDLISNVTAAKFVSNNSMLMTANRGLEGDFQLSSYKIGDTVQLREQNSFIVGDGPVISLQPTVETSRTLTINHQYNTSMNYSSKDLTLKIDEFEKRYISPMVREITRQMEADIATLAIQSLYHYTGTAGTPVASFNTVDAVGAQMLNFDMNSSTEDWAMALSINDGHTLKSALANFFNPTLNSEIDLRSALGHLSYFDVYQNQSIRKHLAGTFSNTGSVQVNGVVTSGSVIPMKGFTPNAVGVLLQGDLIDIAGTNAVSPLGRVALDQDIQFVVTADVNADGAGNANVPISPSIISDTANPKRNVSNPLLNNAVVTTPGTYMSNLAYTGSGLYIVVPPLMDLQVPYSRVVTDKQANVSIRVTMAGDIINDQNIMRMDVLCGFMWDPLYAFKLIS